MEANQIDRLLEEMPRSLGKRMARQRDIDSILGEPSGFVLDLELEHAPERRLGFLSLALIEAQPPEDHVGAGVLGVPPESRVQEVLRLGITAGASVGIREVGEYETVRVGRVQQLQPADLVAEG